MSPHHELPYPVARLWEDPKIIILETKKIEFRKNIISHDRVLPYGHFAKGIEGNGLYSSEKSLHRSHGLAPQNGTKTSYLP